jgi:hypothetical protein
MNIDEQKTFENQLQQFKPTAAGPGISLRIKQGLESSSRADRRRRIASTVTWGSVALAASILITFGFLLFNGRLTLGTHGADTPVSEPMVAESTPEPPVESKDTFTPVLAENNLQNRVDEGIVFLRNGLTARRYRYEFIDRVVWKNPTSGAVVEMEIPRDEVILVPVQTY